MKLLQNRQQIEIEVFYDITGKDIRVGDRYYFIVHHFHDGQLGIGTLVAYEETSFHSSNLIFREYEDLLKYSKNLAIAVEKNQKYLHEERK